MTSPHDLIATSKAFDPLIRPVFDEAIRSLALPEASRGLDAGCGVGLQALMLAKAVGPEGHVVGLDLSPESVTAAEDLVREEGVSDRLSFRVGDVTELPFADDAFDWAWSAHCVGYAAAIEPLSAVREMARVVRPGGRVILLAWSSEQLIPCHPMLEARLRATSVGIAPFAEGLPPDRHYLRALGWFREVGLSDGAARTFLGEAQAPLDEEVKRALVSLFEMRWPGVESELSSEDREAFRELCLPDSPACVLNRQDYVAWFTCTMFTGVVP